MPDAQQHIASLRARFTSGNGVPVERASVPADEALAILAHIEALEADAERLVKALELILRGTSRDCNQVRMPSNEAVRAAFAAIDAARKAST